MTSKACRATKFVAAVPVIGMYDRDATVTCSQKAHQNAVACCPFCRYCIRYEVGDERHGRQQRMYDTEWVNTYCRMRERERERVLPIISSS